MQALVEHSRSASSAYEVVHVLSDKPAAAGLLLARNLGVAATAVPPTAGVGRADANKPLGDPPGRVPPGGVPLGGAPADRAAYDRRLAAAIDESAPSLIVLAGFMRVLSAEFVRRYAGRILNIHPSLLPKYPGLHTHRKVLAAGDPEHGATVHFVTETLDGGPRVVQAVVPVHPDDDEESLAARVQAGEHRIYPLSVDWYCGGRLRCRDGVAWLDGQALAQPVRYDGRSGEPG
jgi:phosphoribosylglycinamide formyltransferase-1